ncbi:MAG TPA: cob(I)yrinic acid a,c-diamide adenosyltransferase [Thermoplasmata archaeon]|nr:cob(I)yrinic acid a,c-diamide adenosyltransferase [Thermoplasmata archaeon]
MATGGTSDTRLYTRTGDRGETGLVGGTRIAKDSFRIGAYGTFDELAACLGVVETSLPDALSEVRALLRRLEHELFLAESELATPSGKAPPAGRIEARHVRRLEADIDRYSDAVRSLRTFVLPTGSPAAAYLHWARALARRAERELWRLHRTEPQSEELLQWSNRLGDLFFALALSANRALGVSEVPPDYSA